MRGASSRSTTGRSAATCPWSGPRSSSALPDEGGRMSFIEGLRVALESLVTNPLRSLLTLLGIVMGVTAIIAVVAIINGLNLYVEERIIKLGPSSFEVNR